MEKKSLPSFKVVGLAIDTNVQEAPQVCTELWEEFMKRHKEIKHSKNDNVMYGLAYETGECDFQYIACVEVSTTDEIPEGMIAKELPEATYGVWIHKGTLEKLGETYGNIQSKEMPEQKVKAQKWWFEKYDERFKMNDPSSEMDIYIPFEP